MTTAISLDQLRIASPCPMKWEQMAPTRAEGVRHCEQCDLNVYNVSEMTGDQDAAFLAGIVPGVRTCAGYYRRADGTILTRDCPVGLRAARAHLARVITRIAALVALALTSVAIGRSRQRDELVTLTTMRPFDTLCVLVRGQPVPPPQTFQYTGGVVCAPSTPAPTQGGSSR